MSSASIRASVMLRPIACLLPFVVLLLVLRERVTAQTSERGVPIRFLDSATGYAVQPDEVRARPARPGLAEPSLERNGISPAGRATLSLGAGRHTLSVEAEKYLPRSGDVDLRAGDGYRINFFLDPVQPPREISPEYVTTLQRANETVFVGYVVDEESGGPIAGAQVRAGPSGREARTDARGYFQIYVPVQTLAEAQSSPARLSFSRPGYATEERRYLELWSSGDGIYRIRLNRGAGTTLVDERELRRRSHYPVATRDELPAKAAGSDAASSTKAEAFFPPNAESPVQMASTPASVRVPINIRVLRQDGVTIDYLSLQTYCQRSLPAEWIAGWGSTGPGNSGTNSLLAGAVALRTYAIGFVNNPSAVAYDICGTTSCQAYNHTLSDSRTTAAVNFTANYVMNQPGAARIGFKITEYSAENNSLGFSCGDGFTQPSSGCLADPVCTGQTRFGHGRGMCQWGTARWASGRRMQNRVTGDAVTNGYPLQNWIWLSEHYYPTLELVQGAPLAINDYVQVLGTSSLTVRECAGGNITSGTGCPQLTTKASGATGLVISGPVRTTTDGIGHTWWRVQWFDASSTIGWSPENWLERIAEPFTVPPVLAAITNRVVNEGSLLTFTASAVAAADAETLVTDFEGFASGTSSGSVLFRQPTFSGSTDEFLDPSPNTTTVTGTFPAGNDGARVLRANWSWDTTVNAWLRLTTSGAANLPNPVIDLTRKLKFDLYSDKQLKVALGIRETGNPAGTAIGSNGGSTPAIIEFAGVTNLVGAQPQTIRTVTASNWTTLTFDLPTEPIRNLTGGNGILSTATGLGVLEHLAFVPAAGTGAYDVYLDNFIVSAPKVLTYSLSNAPSGATINATNGVFAWTPSEAQGPAVYSITVKVTDNNLPPLSDAKTFQVTVNEVNVAPVLAAVTNRAVHAGMLVTFTNQATDADLSANQLGYRLDAGAPPGASVGTNTGVFAWLTVDADAGTTNPVTLRVTDNGVPPLNDAESFIVTVLARPAVTHTKVLEGNFGLTWSAIPGTKYRVQFKHNLDDPLWLDLVPDVTAPGATASQSDPFGPAQRFYRVLVMSE